MTIYIRNGEIVSYFMVTISYLLLNSFLEFAKFGTGRIWKAIKPYSNNIRFDNFDLIPIGCSYNVSWCASKWTD